MPSLPSQFTIPNKFGTGHSRFYLDCGRLHVWTFFERCPALIDSNDKSTRNERIITMAHYPMRRRKEITHYRCFCHSNDFPCTQHFLFFFFILVVFAITTIKEDMQRDTCRQSGCVLWLRNEFVFYFSILTRITKLFCIHSVRWTKRIVKLKFQVHILFSHRRTKLLQWGS